MFKKTLIFATILALLYGINYARKALPILTGYGAKNLCSCVFVAGRSSTSVISEELGAMPLSIGTFQVNMTDSSATGSVMGIASRKAIYRNGLGCTLLSEVEEAELRNQPYQLHPIAEPSDSLYWPYGTKMRDTIFDNVDYKRLQAVVEEAFKENNPEVKRRTRGVVVIYKGHLLVEKYADGFTMDTPQIGWSMTKSVTATMLGLMIKDGLLTLKSDHLVDTWAEDDRSKITLDQLLRMSSGLEWEEEYGGPGGATDMLYKKANMGKFAAKRPLAFAPDEQWYYSSGTSNILSMIIKNELGDKYYNYVRDRLFSPLNMTSAVIEPDPSGTFVGSSYMYATPRDWAKFGLLYLKKGRWYDEALLSDNWVSYVSTPTLQAPMGEYGAHFWLNDGQVGNNANRHYPDVPRDVFSANGFEGQRVFIIPSKDMVVVRMGQTAVRGSFDFNLFLKNILLTVN